MGVIQTQSLKNTILSYIGLVLGYVNIIILFQAFFTPEEYGLISLLAGSVAVVYAQISSLGLVSILVRYFPFFRTGDKRHQGFLAWILLIALSGFIIVTLLYLLFKPLIVSAFIENSPIYIEYYYYVIPISFFLLTFTIFESITRAIHKTVLAVFLKDVLFRVLTTIGIILVYYKVFTFDFFVFYYVLCYAFIALIILIQIISSKEFKFNLDFRSIRPRIKEIIKYGLYTLLAGSSYFMAQNIDKMMIGSMVSIEIVAVYSVFLFMATVIAFPARSMYRIAIPIITEYWKKDEIDNIAALYKRISLILMILGCIIYIGIVINMDSIVTFLKPEYRIGASFFVFLGLSYVIDISGGVNSDIISTSKYYRYDTMFNIIYLVICVALNFVFIPIYGGLGAAIALAIAALIFNLMKWAFLKKVYKMQPFDVKNLFVLIIAAITLLIGLYLPKLGGTIIDILYRSFIVTIVYFSAILLLKISHDVTSNFNRVLARFNLVKPE